VQLLQNALQLTDDEAFGLSTGRRFTPRTHGVMGLLVNSSPNLLMMFEAIRLFVPTRLNFARVDLQTHKNHLEVALNLDIQPSNDIIKMLSEGIAMAFSENARFVLGRPLHEVEYLFAYDEPDYSGRYPDFLPGTYKFAQPVAAVTARIPLALCHLANESANPQHYAMAYKQCEDILTQLHSHKGTLKYQIEEMMLSNPSGIVSEEDAAEALFISKRTLGRRLKLEGTRFREIRDDILARQASRYLRETDMSVEAIAAMLHYHDSSNFRRAFKRWFKMTPQQYRQ
jgi:AraC-like DNA-binding protein